MNAGQFFILVARNNFMANEGAGGGYIDWRSLEVPSTRLASKTFRDALTRTSQSIRRKEDICWYESCVTLASSIFCKKIVWCCCFELQWRLKNFKLCHLVGASVSILEFYDLPSSTFILQMEPHNEQVRAHSQPRAFVFPNASANSLVYEYKNIFCKFLFLKKRKLVWKSLLLFVICWIGSFYIFNTFASIELWL